MRERGQRVAITSRFQVANGVITVLANGQHFAAGHHKPRDDLVDHVVASQKSAGGSGH